MDTNKKLREFEEMLIRGETEEAIKLARPLCEQGEVIPLFKRCTMVTGREVDYQYFSFDHGTLTMEALIGAAVTYCKSNPWPLIEFAIRYIGHLRKIPWELDTEVIGEMLAKKPKPPTFDREYIDTVSELLRKGLPMRAFSLMLPFIGEKDKIFSVFFAISAVEFSQLAHNLIFTSAYFRLWDLFDGIDRVRLLVELLTYFGCAMRITDIQNTLARSSGRGVYDYISKPSDAPKGIRLLEAMNHYPMEEVHWMFDAGYFHDDKELWKDFWLHSLEKPNSLAHAPIYVKSAQLIDYAARGNPFFRRDQMIKNLIAEFYREPRRRPQSINLSLRRMDEMTREGRGKLKKIQYRAADILELSTPQETLAAIEKWIKDAPNLESLFQEAMEAYVANCQVHAINVQYATQAIYNGAKFLGKEYLKYCLFRSFQLGQQFHKDKERNISRYPEIHAAEPKTSGVHLVTIAGGRHKKRFAVPEGDRLFDPALGLLVWLDRTECRGQGKCGRCRVIVTEGMEHLSPHTEAEKNIMQLKGFAACERLACQARIHGDVTIMVD